MANIDLFRGETFDFSKLGTVTILTDSTDHTHTQMIVRNDSTFSGSMTIKDASGLTIKDGTSDEDRTMCQLYETTNGGVMELYKNGSMTVRLRGDGNSSFSGGNVGIGVTSPSRRLEVRDAEDDNHVALIHNQGTSSIAGASGIGAGCLRLRIDCTDPDDDNRYIQFDRNGGNPIEYFLGDSATGGVKFTGNAAGLTSDMRNKENITYLSASNYDASSILKQVDVIEYELKSEVTRSGESKTRRMGFSAQQLLELWPYPVTKFDNINTANSASAGDGNFMYHKLNPGMMSPLIVKTIQELITTIDDLKARIETLESN